MCLLVPAKAGTHMWTAPDLQELVQRADRIACDHMSGLLMAVHMTACQDGFRGASSKQGMCSRSQSERAAGFDRNPRPTSSECAGEPIAGAYRQRRRLHCVAGVVGLELRNPSGTKSI